MRNVRLQRSGRQARTAGVFGGERRKDALGHSRLVRPCLMTEDGTAPAPYGIPGALSYLSYSAKRERPARGRALVGFMIEPIIGFSLRLSSAITRFGLICRPTAFREVAYCRG